MGDADIRGIQGLRGLGDIKRYDADIGPIHGQRGLGDLKVYDSDIRGIQGQRGLGDIKRYDSDIGPIRGQRGLSDIYSGDYYGGYGGYGGCNDYGMGIGRSLGKRSAKQAPVSYGYNDYGIGGYGIGIGRRSYDVDYDSKLGRGYGSGYSQ